MRVALISGSRADYGSIKATYEALLRQKIDAELIQVGDYIDLKAVDLAVVEGDRFEILKTVVDLYLAKIPIVHLGGGDITEGSQDDCLRHAITKLSHLHFPTNAVAAKRIIQMGEEAWRVKTVGEPAIDHLEAHDKGIATQLVGSEDYILVVWHPNTLASEGQALSEAAILSHALHEATSMKKLVVGPNNDAGAGKVAFHLQNWCQQTSNKYVSTLSRDMYLTVLKHARALVGNSSSAYYEAPSFGTPAVNVGDRQKGRDKPLNVIICPIQVDEIKKSIEAALWSSGKGGREFDKMYHTGNAADQIAKEIAKLAKPGHDPKKLLRKRFYHIVKYYE